MRKVVIGWILLCLVGLGSPLLIAGHRYRYCKVKHPSYYYESHGRRHHGRFRVDHFLNYHYRSSRYNDRYRRHHRRYSDRYRFRDRYRDRHHDRYDRRRDYRYDRGRRHRHPPRNRRRVRPRVHLHLDF